MDPLAVYLTAALILGLIVASVARRSFDPFAPVWLFLVGYFQLYVVQALSYREYALRVRGPEVTATANVRALWALAWFLLIYFAAPTRRLAARLPRPPRAWPTPVLAAFAPPLVLWGLFCAGMAFVANDRELSGEATLLHSFKGILLVPGILLLVAGRQPGARRRAWTAAGLAICAAYILVWMFNGKRSHSLFGVLATLCAWYIPVGRRPSKPVLAATAFAGALVVSLAIGWRGNDRYEHNFAGFFAYVGDFDPADILANINVRDRNIPKDSLYGEVSYETEEYGGYLLMLDTVPMKSEYDYGSSYVRLVSTFIPRLVWPDKPYFGRLQWQNAWIAGSEFKRDHTFTGPAIGILGATQLNGGAVGTAAVLGLIALLIRTAYEYYRLHAGVPWVQAFWALTYYNAWLMVVNDDPFVWYYYNYGYSALLPMLGLWFLLKFAPAPAPAGRLSYA
jgi:hypothetical protein